MECAKCIRNLEKLEESDADSVSSSNSTMSYSLENFKVPVSVKNKESSNSSHDSLSESSDTNMSVYEACAAQLKLLRHKREKKSCDVWRLLTSIISML